MSLMDHVSEVVVITGASAGVGRATTRKFARLGARIALLARGTDGLEVAQREVEELGGTAIVVPVDVANAEQVEAAAARVEIDLGKIDIWINNAMASVFSPIKKMTPEEFRRVTEVTYLGCVYGTLAALKRMLPRDHGTIVQVGSALAYRGIPLQSAYCAAKHAIQGFTESLRCELMHEGSAVRVTMVQLPALNTPQFDVVRTRLPRHPQPVPPIYQPEVAARAIAACLRWAWEPAPRSPGAPAAEPYERSRSGAGDRRLRADRRLPRLGAGLARGVDRLVLPAAAGQRQLLRSAAGLAARGLLL